MSLTSTGENFQPTSDLPGSALPVNEESFRISTFQDALLGFTEGRDLASRGFFYDDRTSSIECFRIRHIYPSSDQRHARSYNHNPTCRFDNGTDTRNIPITPAWSYRPISRITPRQRSRNSSPSYSVDYNRVQASQPRRTLFPCDRPVHSGMRYLEDRLATFGEWPVGHTRCSVRRIAEAGFFFCGPDDEVLCWYCGGGLEMWDYDDDPWFEHAKWHSQCNFLLQQKGIEYVDRIVQQTPHITRPTTRRRSNRSAIGTQSRRRTDINTRVEIASPVIDRPPGVHIYPEPQWTRQDVSLPGRTRRTIYRAPGIEVVTNNGSSSIITGGSNIISQRSHSSTERVESQLISEALEMGFSMEDIERVVSRRRHQARDVYRSVSALIDDLLLERASFSHREPPSTNRVRELESFTSAQDEEIPAREHEFVEEIREVQSGPDRLPPSSEESFVSLQPMEHRPGMCCVCEGRPAKTVFLPCSHMVACTVCGSWLRSCPLCNSDIERKINIRN